MQTENIGVTIRARRGWEAVDLGFRIARTWWRPLFGAWLWVVLPVAAVLMLALTEAWLAALLLWWLKPLFDRVALHVLSRALFGNAPRASETLGALPSLLRSGLLRSLLWQRLTPLRSFSLPVIQLEGAHGKTRRERTRLLIGRDTHVAIGLFFACIHFELVLWLGLCFLCWSFLPEPSVTGFYEFVYGSARGSQLLTTGLYVAAMAIVEPFYVAGGFALYISRRMYLEAWDIDLVFRRLAQRAEAPLGTTAPLRATSQARALLPLALLAGLLLATPLPARCQAQAAAPSCSAERPEDAADCIAAVLEEPEFEQTRTITYWEPRWLGGEPSSAGPFAELLFALGRGAAVVFELAAWIALALGLGWLGYLVAWRFGRASRETDPRPEPPRQLFGLDLRPEALPDDVIAAARASWAAGDAIAALSLLYRGALVHLTRARGLPVPASATEGECTRIAQDALEPELARDFSELATVWQLCAYGRRTPGSERFGELCRRWQPRLETQA